MLPSGERKIPACSEDDNMSNKRHWICLLLHVEIHLWFGGANARSFVLLGTNLTLNCLLFGEGAQNFGQIVSHQSCIIFISYR